MQTFSGVLVWISEEAGKKTSVGRNISVRFRRYANGKTFENALMWSGSCKELFMQVGDYFVKKPAGFRRMDRAIQSIPFILSFYCSKLT